MVTKFEFYVNTLLSPLSWSEVSLSALSLEDLTAAVVDQNRVRERCSVALSQQFLIFGVMRPRAPEPCGDGRAD